MRSHDQDAGVGRRGADLPGGVQAIEFRHGQVEHGDVGHQAGGQFTGRSPIAGFRDDAPFRPIRQRRNETPPDELVIVGDQYSGFAHREVNAKAAWTQVPSALVRTLKAPPSCRMRSRMPASPTPKAATSAILAEEPNTRMP